MARLRLRRPVEIQNPEYLDDIERIHRVCAEHDAELTLPEAEQLWSDYSDMYYASWLILPESDAELWDYLAPCFEPVPETE